MRGIVYDTAMRVPQVVIDTNVFVAGLRSQRGASHKLLHLIGTGKFDIHISVPVVLEYEDALMRLVAATDISTREVTDVIDFICAAALHHKVYYLWRPWLKDPDDDKVLELAVTSGASAIITYNLSDFRDIDRFGIRALTPKDFLHEIGALS
jgi:putative PIN family toxin of toxin-antitoxin system